MYPRAVGTVVIIILLLGVWYLKGEDIDIKGRASMNKYGMKELTPEEERIIQNKGTERPFTGKYFASKEKGTYKCRQCGAVLFSSDSKFNSGTGWPSFDASVNNNVKEKVDADGKRTEIVCAKCGGHLGHVFRGEGFTQKNTRHCVNSASLCFMADAAPAPANKEKAIFAGGCFWGVEHYFNNEPGVISAVSGYTGGHKNNPSYKDVCKGDTGHAEAVEVIFDPEKTSYEKLAKLFMEIHDPTQMNRQGPDIGTQYRSEIFYTSEKQKQIALQQIRQLKKNGYDVKTKVTKASIFWKAEGYHQNYYEKKGTKPYCHIRTKRF